MSKNSIGNMIDEILGTQACDQKCLVQSSHALHFAREMSLIHLLGEARMYQSVRMCHRLSFKPLAHVE